MGFKTWSNAVNIKMKLNKYRQIDRRDTRLMSIVVVLYAFFSLWLICSIDSTLYIPTTSVIKKIVAFITLLCTAIYTLSGIVSYDKKLLLFCLFPIGHFLLSYFNHYDDEHLVSIGGVLILIAFLAIDKSSKLQIYLYFRKLLYIMSILGIICYAAYMLGIPLPHSRIEYYGDEKWAYIYYYISVLVDSEGSIRLCGLFNEPGFFGTILGLIYALDIERDNFKIRENIVFIIAGFFTFSLAFIITIAFCFFLKQALKPSRWVIVITLSLAYLFVLPNIRTGDKNTNHLIERLAINEGGLSGDNRSSLTLDMMFAETVNGDNAMWGHGMGYVSSFDMNVSTYKTIIIDSGLGGFILTYVLFMVAVLINYSKIKVAYPFIFVFFLNVYQRPNIYNIVYFIVLFGGLSYLEFKNKFDSKVAK